MRILSRQFLLSYLNLYAGILFASTLVIVVIEMMINLEDALEFEEGGKGVLVYLFLRVPSYYLPYLMPVVSFAAAFFCLGLPARAREVVALKTGGIAPQRISLPVLAAAALISVLTLVLNETIVRDTSNEFNRRENRTKGDVYHARGEFWYHRGDAFYNVQGADRATGTIHGVKVYQRGPEGRLFRTIEAASARIDEEHRWHLRDATIRTFGDEVGSAPKIRHEANTVLKMASEQELALLDADASSLDLLRLREYIDAVIRDGRDPVRYQALFHARLAEPLSVLVFALLALPVGLAVERTSSLATAAVQGVILLGIFYSLQGTAAVIGASGVAAAVPVPWIVLAAFGGFGLWRFIRMPA